MGPSPPSRHGNGWCRRVVPPLVMRSEWDGWRCLTWVICVQEWVPSFHPHGLLAYFIVPSTSLCGFRPVHVYWLVYPWQWGPDHYLEKPNLLTLCIPTPTQKISTMCERGLQHCQVLLSAWGMFWPSRTIDVSAFVCWPWEIFLLSYCCIGGLSTVMLIYQFQLLFQYQPKCQTN